MFPSKCEYHLCRRITRHESRRCHSHRGHGKVSDQKRIFRGLAPVFHPDTLREVTEKTGRGTTTRFYDAHGRLSRTDGPAVTERDESGLLLRETWYVESREHRVGGGPAETNYFPGTEQVAREQWYLAGELSRVDGPAATVFTGGSESSSWYLAGVHMSGPEELVNVIDRTDPGDVEDAFRASPLGSLLDEGHSPTEIADVIGRGVTSLEGVRAVLGGAPVEWVQAYEESVEG